MSHLTSSTRPTIAAIIAILAAGGTIAGVFIWTGYQTFNAGICSGYSICIKANGVNFLEINGTTNAIMLSDPVNASAVIQDAYNQLNKTSYTVGQNSNESRQGGSIHIFNGVYPITHEIVIPFEGNLTTSGDGIGTILQVPTGYTNKVYTYRNNASSGEYGLTFKDMYVRGNQVTSTSAAFYFTGTHGPNDVFFDNVWCENFYSYCFYFNSVWNYNMDHIVCEFTSAYCIYTNNGADFKLQNSKVLSTNGQGGIYNGISQTSYVNDYIAYNKQRGINLAAGQGIVIAGTRFFANGGAADNAYMDIQCNGASRVLITGNTFGGNLTANRAKYAISIATAACNNWTVTGNTFVSVAGYTYGTSITQQLAGLKNITINNNLGLNAVNSIPAYNDPTKQAIISGMQNYAASHTNNFTLPNANGTYALLFGSNSTSNSTAQTFTNIGTFVMQNSPVFIKTNQTGNIFVSFDIPVSDNTINGGCDIKLQYGTWPAPKTGAALSGTTIGQNETFDSATANEKGIIPIQYTVTGLTKTTSYWIEPAVVVGGAGGTCTIRGEMEYVTER